MTARLTSADVAEHVEPVIASHVLWHYGVGGMEPGDFTKLLIEAAVRADPQNAAKLALGFPGYVAAARLARDDAGGIVLLQDLAGKLAG